MLKTKSIGKMGEVFTAVSGFGGAFTLNRFLGLVVGIGESVWRGYLILGLGRIASWLSEVGKVDLPDQDQHSKQSFRSCLFASASDKEGKKPIPVSF